jgi:hypothetical protein
MYSHPPKSPVAVPGAGVSRMCSGRGSFHRKIQVKSSYRRTTITMYRTVHYCRVRLTKWHASTSEVRLLGVRVTSSDFARASTFFAAPRARPDRDAQTRTTRDCLNSLNSRTSSSGGRTCLGESAPARTYGQLAYTHIQRPAGTGSSRLHQRSRLPSSLPALCLLPSPKFQFPTSPRALDALDALRMHHRTHAREEMHAMQRRVRCVRVRVVR